MEYTVSGLARLAGVSARTLRHYDEISLLPPARVAANGYRIYGAAEVDRLQQIMFYRELGVPLDEIAKILSRKDFDAAEALKGHMVALLARRARLDALIANVKGTIAAHEKAGQKGGTKMSDKEKFAGFAENLVADNEAMHGAEARAKYGDKAVDASNAKVRGMSRQQYEELESVAAELAETLRMAVPTGRPDGELAQKACGLHRQWLCFFWDSYSKEAHAGIAQMYVDDPRFAAHYDGIAPGGAAFLRDALLVYCA